MSHVDASQADSIKTASFWRPSLASLKYMLKAKWRWVLGVAVIMAFAQYEIAGLIDPAALTQMIQKDPLTALRAQKYTFLQIILFLPANYVFTVLFLQSGPPFPSPVFSADGFFYWLGKCCQKYLLLFLYLFVPGLLIGALFAVAAVLKVPHSIDMFLAVIAVIALFSYYIHVVIRLSLVSLLAILQERPVFKNSREITQGSCWRIFWGGFVQNLILMLVFLIPYIIVAIVQKVLGSDSMEARSLSAGVSGIYYAVSLLANAIYCCTFYRILRQEKRVNSTILPASSGA